MPVLSDEDQLQQVSDSFNQTNDNTSGFGRLKNAMVKAISNRRSKPTDPAHPDDSEENNQGVE